jgi:hypothetical protein
MIAITRPYPSNACATRLFDRKLYRLGYGKMPHCVIAIHDRHGSALLHNLNIWSRIDATRSNTLDVLWQSNNTVAVRPLQVSLRH